jgi:predicted outer membrane repeat protein/autotransporter-associated beta strand protein
MNKFNQTTSILTAGLLLSALTAQAQLTWDPDSGLDNNGGAGTWSTSISNWWDGATSDEVWTDGEDAIFGSGTYQVDLDSTGVTVGDLTYGGGGVLTFKGSSLSGSAGDTITIATGTGGATWDTGGGEIEFFNDGNNNNTRLAMTSGDTLTVNGGGTFDTGQNPQNNAFGTWDVAGATLDVTGATVVRGHAGSIGLFDTVKLGAGSTFVHERNANQTYANDWELGGGTITFSNRFGGNGNITVNGSISGNADELVVDMGGAGRILNLTQAAAFTAGTIRVAEGQLNLTADNAVSESVIILGGIDGATSRMIMFDTDQAIKGLQSDIGGTQDIRNNTAASTAILTIDVDNGESYDYGSNILGAGDIDIVKTGDGTQIFSYSGGYGTALGNLTTNGGTLNWQNDTAADIGGAITVGASGTFLVGDGATNGTIGDKNVANEGTLTFSRNDAVTYGGVISGGGKLVLDSGVALSLTNDANTFSGGIEVNDGSVVLASTAARLGDAANDITLSNGGILNINGVDLGSTREITLNGTGGSIVNQNNANTFGGKITGSGELQIGDAAYNTFSNRLVLTSATSDYTGGTRIHNGSIELGSNNALPTTTVLTLGGNNSAARFYMEGFNAEIGGLATTGSNTREIVNNGASVSTLTINVASGSHDYGANFNGTNAINIVKTGVGTQTFSRNGGYNTALGDITVNGGELIWNNNNAATQTGTVTVNAGGTLSGSGILGGAVTVSGTLNPGNSPGTMSFTEDLTLTGTAITNLEFTGTGLAGEFDVLLGDTGNTLTAGGTLNLVVDGYTAVLNDTFLVFEDWASFAGSFSSINGTDLGGGLSFDTSNLLTDGTLTVVPEPSTYALLAGMLAFFTIALRRRVK